MSYCGEDNDGNESYCPTGSTLSSGVYEVERIVAVKKERDGRPVYRVRWKDYSPEMDTWETVDNLTSCIDMIDKFHQNLELQALAGSAKPKAEPSEASHPEPQNSNAVSSTASAAPGIKLESNSLSQSNPPHDAGDLEPTAAVKTVKTAASDKTLIASPSEAIKAIRLRLAKKKQVVPPPVADSPIIIPPAKPPRPVQAVPSPVTSTPIAVPPAKSSGDAVSSASGSLDDLPKFDLSSIHVEKIQIEMEEERSAMDEQTADLEPETTSDVVDSYPMMNIEPESVKSSINAMDDTTTDNDYTLEADDVIQLSDSALEESPVKVSVGGDTFFQDLEDGKIVIDVNQSIYDRVGRRRVNKVNKSLNENMLASTSRDKSRGGAKVKARSKQIPVPITTIQSTSESEDSDNYGIMPQGGVNRRRMIPLSDSETSEQNVSLLEEEASPTKSLKSSQSDQDQADTPSESGEAMEFDALPQQVEHPEIAKKYRGRGKGRGSAIRGSRGRGRRGGRPPGSPASVAGDTSVKQAVESDSETSITDDINSVPVAIPNPDDSMSSHGSFELGSGVATLNLYYTPTASSVTNDESEREKRPPASQTNQNSDNIASKSNIPCVIAESGGRSSKSADQQSNVNAFSKTQPSTSTAPVRNEQPPRTTAGNVPSRAGATEDPTGATPQRQKPGPGKATNNSASASATEPSTVNDVFGAVIFPDMSVGRYFTQQLKEFQNEKGDHLTKEDFRLHVLKQPDSTKVRKALIFDRQLPTRCLDVEQANEKGVTLLMLLAETRCDLAHEMDDIMELLVQHEPKIINRKSDDVGTTALIIAAEKGYLCKVSKLLSLGAAANFPNNYAETPLIVAARRGHAHIVYRLLEYGADFSALNSRKETAITVAQSAGYGEIKSMIEKHIQRVKTVFEQEVQVVLANSVKLKRTLFPMHCYSLNESYSFRVVFKINMSEYENVLRNVLHDLARGGFGFMLFIGCAKFYAQQIEAKFWGPCPIEAVLLNKNELIPLQENGKFIFNMWPFKNDLNELIVQCVKQPNSKKSQMKLLIQGFFVNVKAAHE